SSRPASARCRSQLPARSPGPTLRHSTLPRRASSWCRTNLDPRGRHRRLGLADRMFAVVEYAGCEHRIGAAFDDAIDQIAQFSDAARSDHRHVDRIDDRARQAEIEAASRAVAVHAGQKDLADAQLDQPARPFDRVESGRGPAPVRVDLPPPGLRQLRIDGSDDALCAVAARRFADQRRIVDACGIDADLVGARRQQRADVVDVRDAAADRQRNENLIGHGFDHVVEEGPRFDARLDIEKRELVGALLVVAPRDLDRIPGIAQIDEVDTLDDAALGDVQTGNDALGEAHGFGFARRGPDEPAEAAEAAANRLYAPF